MLKMTIDNEEVVSKNNFTIKEEMLSPSSTILNNTYPKSWENDKNYTSRFYYPKDYAKLDIQNFSITPEEAGTTIDINGSATLTDVDTTKESRVLSLKGQTSQTGTPTPTSPIPVNVVSGDNYINICGKNLLNISNQNITLNGVNFKANNGKLLVNGTANADINGTLFKNGKYFPAILQTGTYTFSRSAVNSNVTLGIIDENGTALATLARNSQLMVSNFTISETKQVYLYCFIPNGSVINNYEVELQVEKGSTKTIYEPYIGSSYPIYLGVENLFDVSTVDNNHVLASDGSINYSMNYCVSDFILVKPNTQYTISYIYDSTATGAEDLMRVGYYDSSKTFKTRPTSNSKPWVITTPSDCYYIRLSYQKNSHSNVQVEIGGKQNSYSAYGTTPIELCKIGDYQDYIYKEDGSWYLHKEIKKTILTGAEYWLISNNVFYLTNTSDYISSSDKICISDKYTAINNTNAGTSAITQNNSICFFNTNTNPRLYIRDERFNTTDAFKTWLSSNNTIVYYVLANPTTTEITDTTLLEQLDDIESQ